MKRVRMTKEERDNRILNRYDSLRSADYTHAKAIRLLATLKYPRLSKYGLQTLLNKNGRKANEI